MDSNRFNEQINNNLMDRSDSNINVNITNQSIINKINNLYYKFPYPKHMEYFLSLDNKIINVYFNNTYPIISKNIFNLLSKFINYKLEYGTDIEKNCYNTINMNKFINRLIKKKPIMFSIKKNSWILKSSPNVFSPMSFWDPENLNSTIIFNEYISLDEMEFSSLILFSICTPFINKGSKKDALTKDNYHQHEGILIGIPRIICDKPNILDWKYMLIDKMSNVANFGYGNYNLNNNGNNNNGNKTYMLLNIWAKFYKINYFPCYTDINMENIKFISKDIITNFTIQHKFPKYILLENYVEVYFHLDIYIKKLYYYSYLFFQEANHRALLYQKNIYLYITIPKFNILDNPIQWNVFVSIWINTFLNINNKYINTLYFNTDILQDHNINFTFPSDRIKSGNKMPNDIIGDNLLLIRNFEYDSTSYPGNEYYEGFIDESDNSINASNSFMAFISNPDLNNYPYINIF